ncbi:hypothetical protein KIW84_061358, partial [Lathyrus oleraceus]
RVVYISKENKNQVGYIKTKAKSFQFREEKHTFSEAGGNEIALAMALNNGLRSAAKLIASSESSISKSVSRNFHSTGVKKMGGGHGHSEPDYMHSYHMYNLDKMKYQGLKMSLAVFTAFSIGAGVPIFAVIFQQKKTASG